MTNADFERIVDTSDEWIRARTGIRERRIAEENVVASDMARAASQQALDMAGVSPEEIDLVILGTVTPDYRLPSTACVLQEKMGLHNAVAFDIVAACTGFISGLAIAGSFIETGTYERVLVVGVEKLSWMTNYRDRSTCVLFGDGAGAAVVTPSDNGCGVVSTYLKSDGRMWDWLWVPVGGTARPYTPGFAFDGSDKILMNGSDVFRVAVREMCRAAEVVLDKAGITSDDLALVVPHQANVRIIDALAKRLNVSHDRVYRNIENYGNTSAASIPIALDEANRQGDIKSGEYVLIVAFGGGMIWGGAVVKW